MSDGGWIGVDLDGTLAHYDGWRGVEHIGAPIIPMVVRVKRWLKEGREVKVFTARVSGNPIAAEVARRFIHEWCVEHIGVQLHVTNVKDFSMLELWDDRAVTVEVNTGIQLAKSQHHEDH